MSWEIATIIFLAMTVIIVMFVPLIIELRSTLKKVSGLVDNLNKDLPDILANIKKVTEHTTVASDKLNNAVGDIVEFEQKISNQIKQPVLDAATTIAAVLPLYFQLLFLSKSYTFFLKDVSSRYSGFCAFTKRTVINNKPNKIAIFFICNFSRHYSIPSKAFQNKFHLDQVPDLRKS